MTSTHKGTSSSSQSQEINEEINKQVAQAESKVNTNPTEAQKEAGKTIRFRSINPGESLTDYARAVVANSPETRFRALGTTRLNKYKVEKIFGGIWIRTKKEFAKFASAVENYAFEEDGEGIAYTDNFLYAYYWNIDGQPIPYASVYLNRKQSQDIVSQVNQEIKDGRKDKRAKEYFDSAVKRYELFKNSDYANDGNNSSTPNRRDNMRLGNRLLRKGGYYNNPSLYVKTQRPDNSQQLTSTPTEDRPTSFRSIAANTRFRALGTTRLNKYKVEKIFGGIWIRTKKEFAKFASAVENYAFEEDGEGIAYTDNFLYAYYWNIDGQPIPYASVYLNRKQSQDIVSQVNQEIKDGRKDKRAKEYIDSAIEWAWISKTTNNVNNGNNNSLSNRARNGRLGSNLLRKRRYFNNPSLYVKTQRHDNSQQLTSTPTEDRPTSFRSIAADTRTADSALDTISTSNGNTRRIIMRQGKEQNAGTKHSLFRHYNTDSGVITADDILLIPDVIANGTRTVKNNGKIEYKYSHNNGTKYTVLTEKNNRGAEVFADFYTNESGSARSSNTQLSAQADSITALSADKDNINSVNNKTSFRSIAADTRTADIALDTIEQATADYADTLNNERQAIIDAITPAPGDSLRTILSTYYEIGDTTRDLSPTKNAHLFGHQSIFISPKYTTQAITSFIYR